MYVPIQYFGSAHFMSRCTSVKMTILLGIREERKRDEVCTDLIDWLFASLMSVFFS